MVNPKSLANLKPIKPGEVRNATGKNRKQPLSDAYRWWLMQPVSKEERAKQKKNGIELPRDANNAFLVAITQGERAKKKTDAAKEIREGAEGKATQRVELSGIEGNPLETADVSALTDEQLAERRRKVMAVVDRETKDA